MELASWWPCALLTPPVVATTLRARESRRLARPHAGGARGRRRAVRDRRRLAHGTGGEPAPVGRTDGGPRVRSPGGAFSATSVVNLLLYTLIVAGTEAAAHAWESRQRALAAAVYARQLAEARLHVLSAQLQPHFLFNALHAISALVWEDQARADRLLARLSDLLRLTLQERHPGRDHARRGGAPCSSTTPRSRRRATATGCGSRSTSSRGCRRRWCPGSSCSRWWRMPSGTASPGGSRRGRWRCARGSARRPPPPHRAGRRRGSRRAGARGARPLDHPRPAQAALRPGAALRARAGAGGRGGVHARASHCGWRRQTSS